MPDLMFDLSRLPVILFALTVAASAVALIVMHLHRGSKDNYYTRLDWLDRASNKDRSP